MKRKTSPAVSVILIFGIISLLGDMVYETARSANSQYLNLLGVSALEVGLVFGIGEFLGYFLRLLAGIASDKSGRHWLFMFLGYGLLVVVPIMGFTMDWNILIILILLERLGKALRNPAKDTIVSGVAQTKWALGLRLVYRKHWTRSVPLVVHSFSRLSSSLVLRVGFQSTNSVIVCS